MMLSLSAINMLLFSVIAFSYANLFNIVTYTLWNVNNEQSLYRKKVTTGYFSHPRHALAAWRRSKRQNACFLAFCVHQLLQFTPKSL